MLSFNDGLKVAIICGGEYDNKCIYIKNDDNKPERNLDDEDIYDIIDDDDFAMNKFKRFSVKDRLKLTKALQNHVEPLDEYLVPKYNKISQKINNKLKKEFELTCGTMIMLPSENTERIFVAGMSGSGKSTIAVLYAREYHCMFPKREIIIFTRHKGEEKYKLIKHREVAFDNELLLNPIDITLLSNSLCIFDDCDNIPDKNVNKNLRLLNNDLITNGRKYNIHVLTLQHQLMNYQETRNILNEANKVVFFKSSSKYHVNRYLKIYAGLDKEQIHKIMSLPSRWICLANQIPSYVLHEHGIFLL